MHVVMRSLFQKPKTLNYNCFVFKLAIIISNGEKAIFLSYNFVLSVSPLFFSFYIYPYLVLYTCDCMWFMKAQVYMSSNESRDILLILRRNNCRLACVSGLIIVIPSFRFPFFALSCRGDDKFPFALYIYI